MSSYYIRVAQEVDFDNVCGHLLVVGELSGDCFSCRHVGIDYTKEKYCPACKTDFKYISYRRPTLSVKGSHIQKLCQRRPDLTYVEFSDVKELSDRLRAKKFFK